MSNYLYERYIGISVDGVYENTILMLQIIVMLRRNKRRGIMNQFTSSPPSAAYIQSTLGLIMACRLLGAKSLSKPKLGYCQLDPKEQTSMKLK